MMSTFQSAQLPSHPLAKRAHLDEDSSSDDQHSSPPPRKRRQQTTESRSSGEENGGGGPSHFALPSQGGPSGTARGRKRELNVNDDPSSSEDGDLAIDDDHTPQNSYSTSQWRGPSFPSSSRPPKRVRRTLSDGFSQIGLAESESGAPESEAAYTVQEPGEVGPAVWVGHAPTRDEEEVQGVRFAEVSEEEQEEAVRNGLAVGFWRGTPTSDTGVGGGSTSSVHLPPSYYTNQPSTRHLPPPDEAWKNQQRGVILYTPPPSFGSTDLVIPSRPGLPHRNSGSGSMQLDEDVPRYVQRDPTPMPGEADAAWSAGRFTELPAEETGMEVESSMDVD